MGYLLLQGSARSLPLADESVQTCVTSPPYWGLRQYAGEQREVWGGDAEHAHEWAAHERPGQTGGTGASTLGAASGGHAISEAGILRSQERQQTAPGITSAFCSCGAWYGALGLEPTPDLYVEHIVAVFREVRRVLRRDGTLWLNLGDSYNGSGHGGNSGTSSGLKLGAQARADADMRQGFHNQPTRVDGLKAKDLIGIPWRVAFALQADGWYLRSDIIWAKPNPMPESVTDRPTKAHEYLFLLTKSGDPLDWRHRDGRWVRTPEQRPEPDYRWRDALAGGAETGVEPPGWRTETYAGESGEQRRRWSRVNLWAGFDYYYDAEAIKEPLESSSIQRLQQPTFDQQTGGPKDYGPDSNRSARRALVNLKGRAMPPQVSASPGQYAALTGRNKRTVWNIATQPYAGAHFATFPEALVEPCILAGSRVGDVVLDPFNGSGTSGAVAVRFGRSYVGVDISREYLTEQAIRRVDPLAGKAKQAREALATGGEAQAVMAL